MYLIQIDNGMMVQGNGNVVIDPVLTEKMGCAGSLEYSVAYDNPSYSHYFERITTVGVFEDGITEPVWRGRLLTSSIGFYGTKELVFEGEMAYLNDVMYPPYEYSGDITGLVSEVLTYYNSKCTDGREITLGEITVTDPNNYIARSNEEYSTCWAVLSDKLAELCGGYFSLRYVDGVRYLDYKYDSGSTNEQEIKFGENLLDLTHYIDASQIATVIIPQGAELEGTDGTTKRLTIENATANTSHLTYHETSLVDTYGRIETCVQWDDVTIANNLWTKMLDYEQTMVEKAVTITTKVIDLHLTDTDIERLKVGDKISVVSEPHGLELELLLSERKRNLNEPANDTITLGAAEQTYTEASSNAVVRAEDAVQYVRRYNAALSERIQNAHGLYVTEEEDESGAVIMWLHDQRSKDNSTCLITISSEGIHTSGDGGTTWYGIDFDGEFLARLITTYDITAYNIHGGTLQSIQKDSSGQAITYIDLDHGDVAKFGNIAWIKRESGNESLKWMGDNE